MKKTYKLGNAFSTPIRFIGCVLIIIGLFLLLKNILFAAGLIFLGLIILFANTGIQFDTNNNSYREFISYLGIKTQEWKSLEEFPFVAVLSTNQSQTFVSRGNAIWSQIDKYYDVYLLNPSHRKRILVIRLSSIDEAFESAKEISELLGSTLVQFSPTISNQTKERKKREQRRKL